MTTAVVVGGGIAGLAAAYQLAADGVEVVVLEADARPGGKIHTTPFAGLPAVDCGADAFLARVPHAVELCRELGLADRLVSPATQRAYVWSRGALRAVPAPNFLGVPLDLDALAASGLVSPDGVHRVAADLERRGDPDLGDADEAVGAMIRRRLGDEVVERLIDPLLGGIYAGDADRLSLRAGAPQLDAAARSGPSLIGALRAQVGAAAIAAPDAPVFLAPPEGMAELVAALAGRLGDRLRLGVEVASLESDGSGGWVVAGHRADRVVLATPAPRTAALVAPHSPTAAARAAEIGYAGVVLVTLAVPRGGIGRPLDASGFLVPKAEGLLLTACSWSSAKWAHLDAGPHVVLRASAGHIGDERALRMDDRTLVTTVVEELGATMDLQAEPVEVRVSRWPCSFPQYEVGHAERVAELERALATEAPGLSAVGAAWRGIGIPACVGHARLVARPQQA